MANLNLNVAKKGQKIDRCLYSGQISFPIASYKMCRYVSLINLNLSVSY